jgi:hypothetical protein
MKRYLAREYLNKLVVFRDKDLDAVMENMGKFEGIVFRVRCVKAFLLS